MDIKPLINSFLMCLFFSWFLFSKFRKNSELFLHVRANEHSHVLQSHLFSPVILLHEKFMQFDWLRAVVFQLNLKYQLKGDFCLIGQSNLEFHWLISTEILSIHSKHGKTTASFVTHIDGCFSSFNQTKVSFVLRNTMLELFPWIWMKRSYLSGRE